MTNFVASTRGGLRVHGSEYSAAPMPVRSDYCELAKVLPIFVRRTFLKQICFRSSRRRPACEGIGAALRAHDVRPGADRDRRLDPATAASKSAKEDHRQRFHSQHLRFRTKIGVQKHFVIAPRHRLSPRFPRGGNVSRACLADVVVRTCPARRHTKTQTKTLDGNTVLQVEVLRPRFPSDPDNRCSSRRTFMASSVGFFVSAGLIRPLPSIGIATRTGSTLRKHSHEMSMPRDSADGVSSQEADRKTQVNTWPLIVLTTTSDP